MANNKAIAEGVFTSLIFQAILVISLYSQLGFVIIYAVPLPFIIYSYRNSFNVGIFLIIFNAVVSTFIGGIFGLLLAIAAISIGVIMGFYYKKDRAIEAIVAGIIFTIANFVLALIISNVLYGINITDFIENTFSSSLNSTFEMFKSIGEFQSDDFMKEYQNFLGSIVQLLPFMIISYAIFIAFFNHMVLRFFRKFLGGNMPKLPPLREWRFPKSLILYYLITVLIIVIQPLSDIYTLKTISMNLYPLLQFILAIQGLSLIFFFAYKKGLNKVFNIIFVISFFIPFFFQILGLIGIVDLGFNFRKKFEA